MNAVRDVFDRPLRPGLTRKKRLKDTLTDTSMLFADRVCLSTAAHRQICHVERLSRIVGIRAAKREQLIKADLQFRRPILQIHPYQLRSEVIEASRDRRMSCKYVTGPGASERNPE